MDISTIPGFEQIIAGILINVLLAALSAFSAYGVAWLRKHVSQNNLTLAMNIAQVAVTAAESVGAAYGYDSKAKFSYALNSARQISAAHGISFSDAQWESFIEQAHHELVVTATQIQDGPTVNPNEPTSPSPAGPPGPQTEAGQEQVGTYTPAGTPPQEVDTPATVTASQDTPIVTPPASVTPLAPEVTATPSASAVAVEPEVSVGTQNPISASEAANMPEAQALTHDVQAADVDGQLRSLTTPEFGSFRRSER